MRALFILRGALTSLSPLPGWPEVGKEVLAPPMVSLLAHIAAKRRRLLGIKRAERRACAAWQPIQSFHSVSQDAVETACWLFFVLVSWLILPSLSISSITYIICIKYINYSKGNGAKTILESMVFSKRQIFLFFSFSLFGLLYAIFCLGFLLPLETPSENDIFNLVVGIVRVAGNEQHLTPEIVFLKGTGKAPIILKSIFLLSAIYQ